tara:strand:+ start:83587 stop:84354 length:768 start_codon:yes stop_codon:yes gene_type:complete
MPPLGTREVFLKSYKLNADIFNVYNNLKNSEFDKYAEDYSANLGKSTQIFGEEIDFFAEYKVRDLNEFILKNNRKKDLILDFGSGIGNSIPWFRKYFPESKLICSDVSSKSLEYSEKRYPGKENYLLIEDRFDLAENSIDIIFATCVFHHIPEDEHMYWLGEMKRVLKEDGVLCVFEHNPLNPLTRRTVNQCPFDENAVLISKNDFVQKLQNAGYNKIEYSYRLFFPNQLASLRPLEKYMKRFFLGAQYSVIGLK